MRANLRERCEFYAAFEPVLGDELTFTLMECLDEIAVDQSQQLRNQARNKAKPESAVRLYAWMQSLVGSDASNSLFESLDPLGWNRSEA